ncbi:hypothetical protein D3C80_1624440 [compost metagenome]
MPGPSAPNITTDDAIFAPGFCKGYAIQFTRNSYSSRRWPQSRPRWWRINAQPSFPAGLGFNGKPSNRFSISGEHVSVGSNTAS